MNKPLLIFESSPLYLSLCFLLAFAISWFFYRADYPWGKRLNRVLFSVRFVVVFILTALLLSPILKYLTNQTEKPLVVLALDDSESVAQVLDSSQRADLTNRLQKLKESITENGFQVQFMNLEGRTILEGERVNFDQKTSDLAGLLRSIRNRFEGRNLHSVIIASDGIYNSGSSPLFSTYGFNLHTLGVGDTIPKKDLSIQQIRHNHVTYQGNKFPIQVRILNEGYGNRELAVTLSKGDEIVESRNASMNSDGEIIAAEFIVEAVEKGTQRYSVRITELEEEFTYANNSQTFFINVVEGKEHIILLSEMPHPDISAIKAAIESNPNYELSVYVRGLTEDIPEGDFDLAICHQCTGQEGFIGTIPNLDISTTPLLTFYGKQLSLSSFNTNEIAKIVNWVPGEFDNVTPVFNTAFSSFELSQELRMLMTELPPLVVPFGTIEMEFDSEPLLFQRIGSVETVKPLLVVNSREPRRAMFLGEGIWRWKLHNYLRNEDHDLFNELVNKLVQYLSTKEDKKRLKVTPIESLTTDQSVVLETEVYNSLYERIVGVPVELTVTNEEGNSTNYNYAVSESNSRYTIRGLQSGVYRYRASANLGNETHNTEGQFVVKDLQLEFLNLTADFNLLRNLAARNSGSFTYSSSMNELAGRYTSDDAKGIIHSFESYNPLINLPWILLLVLILVGSEWFTRKYFGSY